MAGSIQSRRASVVLAMNAGQISTPNANVASADSASTVAPAAAKHRHRPATASASGTMIPSCGLYAKQPKQTPASAGRLSSHTAAPPRSAALRNPFCPKPALTIAAG